VKSEILCFVADKGRVLVFDQPVKICTDLYKEEEILAARQVIDGVGTRLPKRQGPNKLRSTVEDIVKAVLNPTVNLPEFHATNLSRLPPVDITHCDTAAILKELQGLRPRYVKFVSYKLKFKICSRSCRMLTHCVWNSVLYVLMLSWLP